MSGRISIDRELSEDLMAEIRESARAEIMSFLEPHIDRLADRIAERLSNRLCEPPKEISCVQYLDGFTIRNVNRLLSIADMDALSPSERNAIFAKKNASMHVYTARFEDGCTLSFGLHSDEKRYYADIDFESPDGKKLWRFSPPRRLDDLSIEAICPDGKIWTYTVNLREN